MSPLLAATLLAIDMARDMEQLAMWWAEHKPALRRLPPAELAAAVAAKEARKADLSPPAAPSAPPPAIMPARRHPLPSGRLL